jgi:hypothetical protein
MRRFFPLVFVWTMLGCSSAVFAELPTNNDPKRQIRFVCAEEATARREKLIRFIWPAGLPDCRPTVTKDVGEAALKQHLKGVDSSLVKRIDRLKLEVLGIDSLAYLIHPVKSSDNARLAIVHAGHSRQGDFIKRDYHDSIHLFLQRGFAAVMMHMPQRGWHDDATAELPNGQKPNVGISKGHAAIVNLPKYDSSLALGAGFRPFLEPVVACVNHWIGTHDGETDVVMIGLSGGGWTTHMAAAVDTRIRLSFPVAGSFPLYLRNRDRGSVGDLEQYFSPLYDENIAPDGSGGGVATWLEIYALGGFGQGRRQVMVTAQHDSCCFRGDPEKTINTFRDVVADRVETLSQGQWEHKLDTTHQGHMISPWILKEIVAPIVPE